MAKRPAQVKFKTVEREEVAPEQVDRGMRAWAAYLGEAVQRSMVEAHAQAEQEVDGRFSR